MVETCLNDSLSYRNSPLEQRDAMSPSSEDQLDFVRRLQLVGELIHDIGIPMT